MTQRRFLINNFEDIPQEFLTYKYEVEHGYLMLDEAYGRSLEVSLHRQKKDGFNGVPHLEYKCDNFKNVHEYELRMYMAKEHLKTARHITHTTIYKSYQHVPGTTRGTQRSVYGSTITIHESYMLCDLSYEHEWFPIPEWLGEEVTDNRKWKQLFLNKLYGKS